MKPAAQITIALALIAGVALSSAWLTHSVTDKSWQAKWSARDAADETAKSSALIEATEKSNRLAAAQEQAAQAYEQGKQDAQNEADSTIAAYRSGTIRLRAQFTCFNRSMSNATTSASVSDAARDCGLSAADVEFLVRFAERADKVAHQLKAAQAIIKADRDTINVRGSD